MNSPETNRPVPQNKESLSEPITYDTTRRPDPYRPFTYAHFDNDPAYQQVYDRLLTPDIISERDADGLINGLILDLGCATGGTTKRIATLYASQDIPVHVVGMDIDTSAIEEAKQKVQAPPGIKITFFDGDATDIEGEDNCVKRVFFLGAFHEIQGTDDEGVELKDKALAEVHRVLEPGGEVIIVSGFLKEVFDFPDPQTGRSAARTEFMKHGNIRKRAMVLLGKERDKTAPQFELLSTENVKEKLRNQGFIVNAEDSVKVVRGDMTIESMRAIGEDLMWTNGTFQDMEETDVISPYAKREAYLQALDELDQTQLFPRNFVMIRAKKPDIESKPVPNVDIFSAKAA